MAGRGIALRAAAACLVSLAAGCGTGRVEPGRPATPAAGRVLLPRGYDDSRRYPVVVLLPASNGRADQLLHYYQAPRDAIVVLAAGVGRPDDYRTGERWTRTIERYERELRADLEALEHERPVDDDHVVLVGFSMGGDLAWALALRNPSLVSGAVVMASRASYRGRQSDLRTLADHGARFYFTMGEDEERSRIAGNEAARHLLDSEGVEHRYRRVPGGHVRAPADVFAEALDYVLRR